LHEFVAEDGGTLIEVAEWIAGRLADRPSAPSPRAPIADLPQVGQRGIGSRAAWAVLRDQVLPTAFPTDHPRYLAFVGGAPTPASVLADAALSASAVYGGSELEAGVVVAAERAAIGWLCSLVGYPGGAHGAFVSGGSLANLSALVAARHGRTAPTGGLPDVIVAGASAHSSIRAAAEIMGCRLVSAGRPDTPLSTADLVPVLDRLDPAEVAAVVASAGATNAGTVDHLGEVADLCRERGMWLHVDAAYGGAAMLATSHRPLFAGIERADSVTIDPHKWLFTPFDCAAVLYRDPTQALAAHRQHAAYLDAVNDHESDNPSDYAVHLTRRSRGIPLWTSLLAYGTDAYVAAVEQCLSTTDSAVTQIEDRPWLELATESHLSVVLFRRRGWQASDYIAWSRQAWTQRLGLVTPTGYAGETVLRFCFVNPDTTDADVALILDSLREEPR